MTVRDCLPVQIGEVRIGRAGQTLTAILGSCIGLGFLMPQRGICGLAHALLARSDGSPDTKGDGRHVDQAIATLLRDMNIAAGHDRRRVQVFLAGGANMTRPVGTDPGRLVGSINADFARAAVRAAGLRLLRDDTGGEHGRRVTIDCSTGDFTIDPIPRIGAS